MSIDEGTLLGLGPQLKRGGGGRIGISPCGCFRALEVDVLLLRVDENNWER